MLDHSPSAPPTPLDDQDEPLTPQRSPSRLDFCMHDVEGGGDSPVQRMDLSSTSFHNHHSHISVKEDAPAVNSEPPALPHLLIVEVPEDDPPQATVSHTHENTDAPPLFFASSDPESMDEVVITPQAPIPVRPHSVQMQANTPESVLPSRTAPQRLNYPHHGFSRSALLQQKILWNSRHEEWVEWQSRMDKDEGQRHESDTDDAYTGLANSKTPVVVAPPPHVRAPLSGLERDFADHPPRRRELDVNASIFPRMGDISALRDPYSVNIDRSFYRLPSWTLQKALFAFDMQRRSGSLAMASMPVYNAEHIQASVSSSTLSSYSSSTSGDDEESDSTLVADDSPVPKSRRPLEPRAGTSCPSSSSSWNNSCGWESSWHTRWEVLIGIFQPDYIIYDALYPAELAAPIEATLSLPSPPGRIFRFTIGDNEDDDEEEDYGTPITDSSFSVDFDEECERALAFYHRELKSPEVIW